MVQSAVDRLHMASSVALLLAGVMTLTACTADASDQGSDGPETIALGPVDGVDLPPTDLDRVQVGQMAPDFTLNSLAGPAVTLSGFRGVKDVVLVFYRGHW